MGNEMSGRAGVVIKVRDLLTSRGGLALPAEPAPLVVTPELSWAKDQEGLHCVVNVPISEVPQLTDPAAFLGWLDEHEVVQPPDNTRLELLVEGTEPQAVVLTDVVIDVSARRPPSRAEGVELSLPVSFERLEPEWFQADLSVRDRVSVRPNLARDQSGDFRYFVHQAEPARLAVDLELGGQEVEWLAQLSWTSAGQSGVLEISAQGKPFVSRPAVGRPRNGEPSPTNRKSPSARQWCVERWAATTPPAGAGGSPAGTQR